MKKKLQDNPETIIIILISLAAFIVGGFAINWIVSIIIVGLCDLMLLLPTFKQSAPPRAKHASNNHTSKKRGKKEEKKKRKAWKIILTIILFLGVLGAVAFILFMIYIVFNAPDFDPDLLYKKESSILYDINKDTVTTLGTENRETITYDELPEVLIDAIVATEDSRFFQHNGVDWARFLKATAFQLVGKKEAGGASTLTMQISKNAFTSKEATGIKGIIRKFTDVYISMAKIEKKYTKQEIMEFYVNSYYLGSGAYGVEQASQTYFNKSVSDLTLAEASIIAGLFQAPGSYDPNIYPENAEKRRNTVLNLMERHGYITKKEKEAALAIPVKDLLKSKKDNDGKNKYQDFIDTVIEQVTKETGESPYKVPMEIYTTLDPSKQDYVNDIMSGKTWKWQNSKVNSGIAVVDTKTGAIAAIGAGRNRSGERTFNTATMISNQIGSTAKPLYDYAPGIEYENWSTYTPFPDQPHQYSDGTKINNWDGRYEGFLTSRNALAHSRNTSALKAFQANKNSNIKKFVTSLGLHPEIDSNGMLHEAHAIGGYNGENPLSMAAAYASFGNGGYYIKPYSYTKIVYRETGEEVKTDTSKKRVMSDATAYMVYDMLISTAKYGLGNQSNINGATFGAKTGTSNFDDATFRAKHLPNGAINDYWVTGVSPDYAISVWYGYDKISAQYCNKINEIYHRKLFQKVAQGFFKKGSKIKMPSSVVKVAIERGSNPARLANEYTPDSMKVTELFKKGTEPTETSTKYTKLSNVTNLKGVVSDNTLTLSWNPVKATDNSKSLGNIIYHIYSKSSNGSLSLINTTTKTSITIKLTTSSPTTYVVKTSYSNYSKNMSSGVSTTISLSSIKPSYTSSLLGDNPYNVVGTYSESGVKVMADGSDITSSCTIDTSYVNSAGTPVTLESITTTDTYTATYNINCRNGEYTNTLTRTIIVP